MLHISERRLEQQRKLPTLASGSAVLLGQGEAKKRPFPRFHAARELTGALFRGKAFLQRPAYCSMMNTTTEAAQPAIDRSRAEPRQTEDSGELMSSRMSHNEPDAEPPGEANSEPSDDLRTPSPRTPEVSTDDEVIDTVLVASVGVQTDLSWVCTLCSLTEDGVPIIRPPPPPFPTASAGVPGTPSGCLPGQASSSAGGGQLPAQAPAQLEKVG